MSLPCLNRLLTIGSHGVSLCPQSVEGFLEEAVVRRELSDNYCYYNQQYDDISTSYSWVTETLKVTATPT